MSGLRVSASTMLTWSSPPGDTSSTRSRGVPGTNDASPLARPGSMAAYHSTTPGGTSSANVAALGREGAHLRVALRVAPDDERALARPRDATASPARWRRPASSASSRQTTMLDGATTKCSSASRSPSGDRDGLVAETRIGSPRGRPLLLREGVDQDRARGRGDGDRVGLRGDEQGARPTPSRGRRWARRQGRRRPAPRSRARRAARTRARRSRRRAAPSSPARARRARSRRGARGRRRSCRRRGVRAPSGAASRPRPRGLRASARADGPRRRPRARDRCPGSRRRRGS